MAHLKSFVKLRQDPRLRNIHQNSSSKTLSKYYEQSVWSYDQKCRYVDINCTMTLEFAIAIFIPTTLRKEHGNWKHV